MVRPLFLILEPVSLLELKVLIRYSLPASKNADPLMVSFSLSLPLEPVVVLFNSIKSLGGSPIVSLDAKDPELLGSSSVLN